MFNLHQTALTVITNHESADTSVLTDAVFAEIPEEAYRDVIRQLLRPYVLKIQGRLWSNPTYGVPAEEPMDTWVDDAGDPNLQPKPRAKALSRSRAAVVDYLVQRYLDGSTDVNGVRKRRGEMTLEDLTVAAQARREQARVNTLAAQELDNLAGLLVEYGVSTVAELPAGVLSDLAKQAA